MSQLLVRLAARTLVLELNVARATGRLAGATPTERFASFVQHRRRRAGLASLLAEYLVLCRLLCQACRNTIEAYQDLMSRLAADRPRLVAELLAGFEPDLDLRAIHVLDCGDYGWAEYVPRQPCATPAEVARFYRRLGALMAVLYATDGTDMHCENLIACGEQPMLVDLETLFYPPVPPPGPDRQDPALDCLESSVYLRLPRVLSLPLSDPAAPADRRAWCHRPVRHRW